MTEFDIFHRGPDDQSVWTDETCHAGLAHRRFSIFAFLPIGHQLMKLADNRVVIMFNGETYNHPELRLYTNSNNMEKSE